MQNSSMIPPILGKISLTQVPFCPYCDHANGDFIRLPVAKPGAGGERQSLRAVERVPQLAPAIESAGQRADADDPVGFQSQRHTGARGFVWSTAVQHDVPI